MDKKMILSFMMLNAILQTMAASNAIPGGRPPLPRNRNNDNSESAESLQDQVSGKIFKPLKTAAVEIGMFCRDVHCIAAECYKRVQHRKFAACMAQVRDYTTIHYDDSMIQDYVSTWFPDNKGLKAGQQMQVLLQNLDYNNTNADQNVAFKNNTHDDNDDDDVITDVSIVETTTISSSIQTNASVLLMPTKPLVANNMLHNHTDALYKFHYNDTLAQNVQIEPLSFELNMDIQNLNDSKINLLPNITNSLDQKIKHKTPQHLKRKKNNATTSTSMAKPTTPIMEPAENNEITIENLNSSATTVNVPIINSTTTTTTPSTISTSTSTSTTESTVAASQITTTTTPSIISTSTSTSTTESTVAASQIAATTQLHTTPIQSTTTKLITSTKPPPPSPPTTTTTTSTTSTTSTTTTIKPNTTTTTFTTSTTIKPNTTTTTLATTTTKTTRQPSNITEITTPIPATTLSETVTAIYNIIEPETMKTTTTAATSTTEATTGTASSTTLHIEKNKISNSTTTTAATTTTTTTTTTKPTKNTHYTNNSTSTMRPIITNATPSNKPVDNNIQRTASRQLIRQKPIRYRQQYESRLTTNTIEEYTDSKIKNKLQHQQQQQQQQSFLPSMLSIKNETLSPNAIQQRPLPPPPLPPKTEKILHNVTRQHQPQPLALSSPHKENEIQMASIFNVPKRTRVRSQATSTATLSSSQHKPLISESTSVLQNVTNTNSTTNNNMHKLSIDNKYISQYPTKFNWNNSTQNNNSMRKTHQTPKSNSKSTTQIPLTRSQPQPQESKSPIMQPSSSNSQSDYRNNQNDITHRLANARNSQHDHESEYMNPQTVVHETLNSVSIYYVLIFFYYAI
ncbi:hypothetical protein DiNV_CH01M_ORF89 [Drosophila innubila nudivirus]|uniref:Uncharacterized protein n=1 Tax=Drosophila innubila nudivirus TaxID=2057187 RepID=A0A2H4UXD0_9VIRU|nr:hypothetical protein DiNV_CH01M_ORF89 [Drosophila innubila nudivirus]ATZ81577.1 hypothetical protein DiNV_CH01M_ORF89 [Drosophila innubila nudivirus]